MDPDEARSRLLDAAEALFYDRGIQTVGMDDVRAMSGVSLKRMYRTFPSKNDLVEAYLRRRDHRWRSAMSDYVAQRASSPEDQLLAVFDWLQTWFSTPGYRGCAFINSFAELGTTSAGIAGAAHDHKNAVLAYVAGLVDGLRVDESALLAEQLVFLIDGAITTAAFKADPAAAQHARLAAEVLVTAATARRTTG